MNLDCKARACLLVLCLACFVLLLTGCVSKPLLYAVEVKPSTISPNADGEDDVAQIIYRVSRPAHLSIYLVDGEGERHYFREDSPRSLGQEYEAWFGGAISGQVLEDGEYALVIEATDERGQRTKVERRLVISGADTKGPEIRDFGVSADTFTPNQDGLGDRVGISFRLTKRALVRAYLQNEEGNEFPIGPAERKDPGVVEYDYDGGVDRGVDPPPDGKYMVVVEAIDEVGNRTVKRAPLAIVDGGVPRAEIVKAELGPLVVPLGHTLTFTATVKNTGRVPLRTTGPPPGTTYTSSENYDTKGFYQEPGAFRIGLDYEGNSIGREYPYRWALGEKGYLAPGEEVTVVGYVKIVDKPPYYEPYFWLGLLHERVRKVNDRYNPTQITIGY